MTTLYHFTKIRNVPSIMRHGLRPHSSCRLVAYAPVVWLTEQQTRRDFAPGWRRDCLKRGWRGSPTWLHDRSLRLVVFKPNVPIIPWLDWAVEQPFAGAIEMYFARRYMSKWWITFAPIAPDCISVGATR
jgi:hypothetical protein